MELAVVGFLALVAAWGAIAGAVAIGDRLVPPEKPAAVRLLVRIVLFVVFLGLIGALFFGLAMLLAPVLEPFF